MGSRYLEFEKQGGLARMQAALAEMFKAARLRLRGLLPYLVIPFIFLVLTLICFLLHFCVARAHHLWLSRRATSWLARKPEFRDALQSLIREIQELQRQRGERPIPQPRVLIFRSARGDGYVVGSSWRPFLGLSSAMPTILREDTRQRGEPFRFRAVVVHELAHLANRDLTRSYWNAGGPLHSSLTRDDRDASATSRLWQLLVLLSRRCLGRRHPTFPERWDVLDHPNRTLVLTMDVSFLAGLLCGNLVGSMVLLTSLIVQTTISLGDLIACA